MEEEKVILELDDIQSGVLRPRPTPYVATYIVLRIDEPQAGRELMRRLSAVVTSAAAPTSPLADTWVSVALSCQGLKALGVPQHSIDSFAWEFRQGMASRWKELGDTGESSPENWEKPLGTSEVHVVIVAISPNSQQLEIVVDRARKTYKEHLSGITPIWRQNCHVLPNCKEPFGYRDGISHPAIEGSGIPGTNPQEDPFKAGEFVLGYPDEMGGIQKINPDILGRNGTYIVFRKLQQKVAAFRQYLKEHSINSSDEELLAAKMMGRWRSGAPLALCPFHDDLKLGEDAQCNNNFLYEDDPMGLKTPPGSHIRRTNPRDASVAGVTRLHRMIRRGTAYGSLLPEGVLKDDGADRGLIFAFVGAHLGRQFEFVQSQWINDGVFFGGNNDKDPITGANEKNNEFTIPHRPVRKRLKGIPQFVVTRGGEYCFMPSIKALRWLADLHT